jgi:hypothetical protein
MLSRVLMRGVLSGCLLAATVAWPCSGDTYVERLMLVSPARGSTEVPLNAEVKLVWSGLDHGGSGYSIVDVDTGAPVPSTSTATALPRATTATAVDHLVRLRPSAPLLPRHTYAVLGNGEVSRFETGSADDTTAPGAPGPLSSSFEYEEDHCFGNTSLYELSFDAARDAQTPPSQLVYLATLDGPTGPTVAVVAPVFASRALLGGRKWVLPTVAEPSSPHYQLGQLLGQGNLRMAEPTALKGNLQALDWAGNVGAPRPFDLSPGLAGTTVDRAWRLAKAGDQSGVLLGGLLGCAGLALAGAGLAVRWSLRARRVDRK